MELKYIESIPLLVDKRTCRRCLALKLSIIMASWGLTVNHSPIEHRFSLSNLKSIFLTTVAKNKPFGGGFACILYKLKSSISVDQPCFSKLLLWRIWLLSNEMFDQIPLTFDFLSIFPSNHGLQIHSAIMIYYVNGQQSLIMTAW